MTHVDDLDELLADARALLDAELDAERPPPDVLGVLQRARELAYESGESGESVELNELNELNESDESGESDESAGLERALQVDPELAELNADARLLLDGLLERRSTVKRTRWRRRPRTFAAAAAAFVLLGLASAAFASKKWQALEAAADSERFAAATIAELDHEWLAESERARSSALAVLVWTVPLASSAQMPPAPAPVSESTQGPSKPDAAARLAELDAQAYALLRAGQHEQAARQFRTIVKIGGRSEYAELAFGELFALARRDGATDEHDELWSAYLKRFPHGRYADAARAGLCRRTAEPDKAACWTDYLLEHPRGAARNEALRESSSD